ncbi:hypothetical protein UFOVP1_22 [uncultured Caudovirales phage]|uniref:Uncharacterized protein n=1 Tax=uncultured Caudovirales phage TaxID=2100421 RepID=A0A6J5KH87_9CAUD|nr:hypothetical protein UFOVP1_22 [uncultured Caudovirales phage]
MNNLVPLDVSKITSKIIQSNKYFVDPVNNKIYMHSTVPVQTKGKLCIGNDLYPLTSRSNKKSGFRYALRLAVPEGKSITVTISDNQLVKAGIFSSPKKAVIETDTQTIYKSKLGKTQSKKHWYDEAIEFYSHCEMHIPINWWNKWVKVLELEKV